MLLHRAAASGGPGGGRSTAVKRAPGPFFLPPCHSWKACLFFFFFFYGQEKPWPFSGLAWLGSPFLRYDPQSDISYDGRQSGVA